MAHCIFNRGAVVTSQVLGSTFPAALIIVEDPVYLPISDPSGTDFAAVRNTLVWDGGYIGVINYIGDSVAALVALVLNYS